MLRIYLHRQNQKLELAEVTETLSVSELASTYGGPDASIWLEDADESLDPDLRLSDAGVRDRSHVHVSRCRRVDVGVRYAGDTKTRRFPPSATIARVFAWATGKKGFELTESEGAKHTLGICDTLTQPDRSEHIGSLAGHACSVCLDLAPKERFEG